jgi:hypothetical protein
VPSKKNNSTLRFEPSMAFKQTLEMVDQHFLELRVKAIKRKVLNDAAVRLRDEVLLKIPQKPQYSAYRQALRVIEGGAGDDLVFGVQAIPTEAEEIDKNTDLITFRPTRKNKNKPDPVVDVLVKYQPWTLDTLPFAPDPEYATLISKRAALPMVKAVSKSRELQRREWTDALVKAGRRVPPRKEEVDTGKIKGMPDFVYQALALEFGLGGVKATAAWRPALVTVKGMVSKMFADNSAGFAEALLDWQNTEWKKWRTLSAEKMSLDDIATFQGFQNKVT